MAVEDWIVSPYYILVIYVAFQTKCVSVLFPLNNFSPHRVWNMQRVPAYKKAEKTAEELR